MADTSHAVGLGDPIGRIDKAVGEVVIVRPDGSRVAAAAGDPLFQGDTLETGANGALGVVFADETTLAMAENGQMVLDEMVYDPIDQSGHMSLSVGQGVFTFVSGQLAKVDPEAMVVQTPVATIGIRGTQAGIHIPDGKSLTVVMMEEADGMVGEIALYNDYGTLTLNMAGAAATIAGFNLPPFALDTFTPEGIVGMFSNTLMYLPLQFAPENNYGVTAERMGQPSAEEAAQFETAAGGEEPGIPADAIRVVGDDYTVRPEGAGTIEVPEAPEPPVTPTAAPAAAAERPEEVPAPTAEAEAANVAPQALSLEAETQEDTVLVGELLATDVDSETLTYAVAEDGGPAHGSLVLNPDGTYVYTPDANYNGADSFTYQVDDGEGGVTTATVTLTVGAVEDIPTAEAAAGAAGEDALTLSLDLADKIADVESADEALTLMVDTGDTGWLAAIDGTTVTLTAPAGMYDALAAGETATEMFTYAVTDEAGETTTSTIGVTVTGTNDLPVASDIQVSGLEDETVSGQLTATDVDSATLTFALAADGGPAHGEVVVNPDGTYTYTPAENFHGTDQFTYEVDDGAGGTTTATATVTVVAVEDIPTAAPAAGAAGEDMLTLTLDLADKIADVETATEKLAIAVNTAETGWTATVNGTLVTLTAMAGAYDALAAGETATEMFTYTVTDEAGATATSTIGVTVTGTNDLPVASNIQVSGLEDETVSGQLIATDVDSDTLLYALAADGGPENGEVVVNPDGSYTYTPNPDFFGTDSFTYQVDDGAGGLAVATVTVDVVEVPEPGPEPIYGTEGADVLRGTGGEDAIYGLGGDDKLYGKGGDDLLDGGAGDDLLKGGGGDDVLYGGDGRDELFGEGGDDALYGGGGTDVLKGGGGDDVLHGGEGADELYGQGGDDVMYGEQGADWMEGGGGDDVLYGGEGADRMEGGGGDDVLIGGEGADRLTGGGGHDTFVFDANAARDIIEDFQPQDTLRFEGPEFSADDVQFKQTGDNVTISFKGEGGTSVVLENVDLDQSSYTVTQDADAVVITMDDKGCGG